jgi:hypothetical protein
MVNTLEVNAQAPATFLHPGAMNNQADLDFVKAKIAAGEQPWLGEFNQVLALATAGTNAVAPNDENGQKTDARKAYANALSWYYTGNATYAQNAIGILNMRGTTFTGYTSDSRSKPTSRRLDRCAAWTCSRNHERVCRVESSFDHYSPKHVQNKILSRIEYDEYMEWQCGLDTNRCDDEHCRILRRPSRI